ADCQRIRARDRRV
ncbi:prpF family protein, partial [Vibrio parahaemolyticus VPTS-2010]